MPRIALIHATPLPLDPINAAFERHWPEAELMNVLDDSLSRDREREGELTPAMIDRFIDLAAYAKGTGANAILYTCSAFGPAIEAAGRAVQIPTLKPNEAMFEQALGLGRRITLIATFRPSLLTMSQEMEMLATAHDKDLELTTLYVPEAMTDLAEGRFEEHDRKIVEAAAKVKECDGVMLAQFSMARVGERVQQHLPCPVLTSPGCAVLALKQSFDSQPGAGS
jgi:Asp/Glu/hydantoin racemase